MKERNYYGWTLLLIFIFYTVFYETIHSISSLDKVLSMVMFLYLLPYWILELIRHRGGVSRPKNEDARRAYGAFFLVALLSEIIVFIPLSMRLTYGFLAPVSAIGRVVFGVAIIYTFVLWILEIIRGRGGIMRTKNERSRKIFLISMIVLSIIGIAGQVLFAHVFGFTL